MMCKVIIFGSIAAAILLTAAYGVPVEKTKIEALLRASLSDLDLLKGIDNVSGDFLLSEYSFVFGFFYVIFLN